MHIAYTMAGGRGQIDLLLFSLAQTLITDGYHPIGIVQINSDRPDCRQCDMDVQVLPDGPIIQISQALGRESKGCRLVPSALEKAVGLVAAQIETERADCLVVNKFGKHEAGGRGFRPVIAEAIGRGIPVIVGLNAMNEGAFREFTADMAVALSPSLDDLYLWVKAAISARTNLVTPQPSDTNR